MSGHWRFCVAASLFIAGLPTAPALSNPLTDLFNPPPQEAAAPAAAPAPAPTTDQCVSQPGRSTPGRHWVYHLDGHRKCWYQADEATVAAKRQAQHHVARRPVIADEDNEGALHKKTVADARAQLLGTAPSDAVQTTPPAPEAADPASAPASATAAVVSAAPIVAAPTPDQPALDQPRLDQPRLDQPRPDQPAPEQAARRPVDVEMLLAAATPVGDTGTSAAPATAPGAPAISNADTGRWASMAPRAGLALIALGFVFVIVSLLAGRFLGPGAAAARRA